MSKRKVSCNGDFQQMKMFVNEKMASKNDPEKMKKVYGEFVTVLCKKSIHLKV